MTCGAVRHLLIAPGTNGSVRTSFVWGAVLGFTSWIRPECFALVGAVTAASFFCLRRQLGVRRWAAFSGGAALVVALFLLGNVLCCVVKRFAAHAPQLLAVPANSFSVDLLSDCSGAVVLANNIGSSAWSSRLSYAGIARDLLREGIGFDRTLPVRGRAWYRSDPCEAP